MKKFFFILALLSFLMLPPRKSTAQNSTLYLLPKVSFNFPAKGGSFTAAFGGGLGCRLNPAMSIETTYLKRIGRNDTPDTHIIEFDTLYMKSGGLSGFFMQAGSGLYKVTDLDLDTGMTAFVDYGIGLMINFIPSMNLRLSAIYYSLFKHKDFIGAQAALVLNF